MTRTLCLLTWIILGILPGYAQDDVRLPADLREHNLTQYNASLFNPVNSLTWNNPPSVSVWARWQWQMIDGDPSTLFVNYTGRLNEKSAVGAGFIQHNTGVFFDTGGVLNYARVSRLSPLVSISYGANLFGFVRELADDRFQPGNPTLPQQRISNDFVMQFAPGINLMVENLSLGLASENLLDYNFSTNEANSDSADKIFLGMVSYDVPMTIGSDDTAYLRPSLYLRTIPNLDNQVGVNALLSTRWFWGQLGYNNFYGIAVSAGGTVFNRFSLGALVEFATSSSMDSKDPSFEIVASYFLRDPSERRHSMRKSIQASKEVVEPDGEEKMEEKAEQERIAIEEIRVKDSIAQANALAAAEDEQRRMDAVAAQMKADSLANVEKSKAKAVTETDTRPKKGEKYEEVSSEGSLKPGYYLIANVFGTQKYYDAFMKDLKQRGLTPDSFQRSTNNYHYVYLARFDTMAEARRARDSQFDGKYQDKTWIFRVVGN